MKRTIPILLAALLLAPAAPVRAASAPGDQAASIRSWFQNVRLALKRSAVRMRYRRMSLGAVAAVRGNEQYWGPEKPYWKGGWSEKTAAERAKERDALEDAVALVLDGKSKEGRAAVDEFEKAYPKSPLVSDLAEIRAKLAELEAAEAPAAEPPAEEAKAPEAPKPAEANAPEPEKAPEAPKPAEVPDAP